VVSRIKGYCEGRARGRLERLEDRVDLNKDFARVSRAETATIAMLVSVVIHPSNLEQYIKSSIDSLIGFILYVIPASSTVL
jgi:hypothetical protein